MKKILSILCVLCLLMGLAFAGCADSGADKAEEETKNTYETPLDLIVEMRNNKKADNYQDLEISLLNGFAEKEVKAIYDILEKSDSYKTYIENSADSYQEYIDANKEEYGDDYKYTYKIDEKEKMDDDALEELQDGVDSWAEELESIIDNLEGYSSSDWDYVSYACDLSESEREDLIKALKDLYDVLDKAEVTEGYELTTTITLKGENLEEPEENESTVECCMIDGRWVCDGSLSALSSVIYMFYSWG